MPAATVLKSTRGPYLLLTPICVLLGVSIVALNGQSIDPLLLILIMVGALAAHVSVNTFNEYFDFKSGLDLITEKTPFSGGSGALPDDPSSLSGVFITAVLSLVITIALGCYFIWVSGPAIFPLGLVGVFLIVAYTNWINKLPFVCLIAPGFAFGLLMVLGTEIVLTGGYSTVGLLIGLIPFFQVNNLLLLSQFPDMDADSKIGRYHLGIAYGIKVATFAYGATVFCSIATLLALCWYGVLPLLCLLALLPMCLSIVSLSGAIKHGKKLGQHPQFLAMNVAATLLTSLVLALCILFA